MTYTMNYIFEELPVTVGEQTLYAEGTMTVTYSVEKAQPDVGFMRSYACVDELGPMDYNLTDEEGNMVAHGVESYGSTLHSQILLSISTHSVEEACAEHYEMYHL